MEAPSRWSDQTKAEIGGQKPIGSRFRNGGLGVQPIENTVQGFQQNLLQKIYRRGANELATGSLLPRILNALLIRVNSLSLEDHVERCGPQQWLQTA